MGGLSEEWNAAAARLEALPRAERTRSKDFAVLHRVALDEGPRLLCKRFGIEHERARDLAVDLLVVKLHELIDAGEPYFAYFVSSVVNKGRDWLKRKASAVAAEPVVERADDRGDDDADASLDARRRSRAVQAALLTLPSRDQQVFAAECTGHEREAIAAALGIRKDYVDTIISRTRKKLKAALEEEGLE